MMDDDQIEACEEKGAEGIPTLMEGLNDALEQNDDDEIESILDACLRLCSSPSEKSKVCRKLDCYLRSTLVNVLEKLIEEAAVIEVLLALLVKVITTRESQNLFGSDSRNNNNTIKLLIETMSIHESEGEETLLQYACMLIENLAQGNDACQKKLIEHGVNERLTVADSAFNNDRNKKYVVQARAALTSIDLWEIL